MGKIRGRSGEGLSGLVGNVVFYNYNGETCFRSVPRKRAKNSWSERQVLNRERFSAIKAFWSRFDNSLIREIWMVAEQGKRGDNLFVSVNLPAFGPGGTLIDPERLHFSAGQMPMPYRFMAAQSSIDPSRVNVTWQDDPGSSLTRSDDALMMMVAHGVEFAGPVATGALRGQESTVIQLPSVTGTVQGIYLFFASGKRNIYSPDRYFGI
jgi:hypothetical protein